VRLVGSPLALLLLLAVAAPAAARAEQRVAVMPLEETSKVRVGEAFSRALAERLAARHHAVVPAAEVEAFLDRERIRWMDSLPPEVLARLLAETGATRVLQGHVLAASERPLLVAVKLRLVGPGGRPIWSDVAVVREERGGGLLTARKVGSLPEAIAEAARRLADGIPDGRGDGAARPGGTGALLAHGGLVAFRVRGAGRDAPVAILAPTNYSPEPLASRLVAELLAVRVGAQRGIAVVEPDALRRAAVATDLRLSRRLDADDMSKLAPAVGTRLFLRTTVLAFEPGLAAPVGTDARVALEMTLVEAGTGRILWTAIDDRRASDYAALLRPTPIRDVVSLADRVVDELVGTLW
jgi:hypothetical protein